MRETLTPPAVEPVLPPTNISMTVISQPASESSSMATVLYPAVLGVTDWKNEAKTRCGSVRSLKAWFASEKKKNTAPPKMSASVAVMTIFVCRLYFLKRNLQSITSLQTINPSPPTTMRNMMVRLTTGSPTYGVSDGKRLSAVPKRSNPALQNEDTA